VYSRHSSHHICCILYDAYRMIHYVEPETAYYRHKVLLSLLAVNWLCFSITSRQDVVSVAYILS
jgi:hypothetical protein